MNDSADTTGEITVGQTTTATEMARDGRPLTVPLAATATASRRGVRPHNCDAHATHTGSDGTTAVAVVDGIGNSPQVAEMARTLATVIAHLAVRVGVRAALLTAGQVVADRGLADTTPDAVAVVAVSRAGRPTDIGWCGDALIYGFDGHRLTRYSTPATVGEQLRANGAPWEIAADHDNWVTATLGTATVGTVYAAEISGDQLVLLCSDGVPDGLPAGRLEELVADHADDITTLAQAVVTATGPDADGYRDDATLAVLEPAP